MTDARDVIAARAAQELHSGEVVNLGIGIPNRIPGFLDPDVEIFLHTENGLLGVGPRPAEGEVDLELIDAGKKPVTLMPGAAAFDSASSFAMIRGGHVDTVVLACTLPLTASGVVKVVITEHAVFRLLDGELVLTELLDGATAETVAAETSARYRVELG